MKYKNFTLDQFQIDAIESINKNHSVVVSAATGTGKTLIADYIINTAVQTTKKTIYTAPIKALSNQKYKEFHDQYGDKVGMLTGDIVINPSAQILIMTTEIYRNMLLEHSPDIEDVHYVIFDEIHFINDIERGTVWEESIIFSPPNVRFLCLSATIPNYKQFASWIQTIKNHQVDTVHYMKRAVPLTHKVYDIDYGMTNIDTLIKESQGQKKAKKGIPTPYHIDLINELDGKKKLPAIFFSFSRKLCEQRALELAKKKTFTTPDQRKEIIEYLHNSIPKEYAAMQSTKLLKTTLPKGVGVHHAGILPKLKDVVEHLFDKGFLQVLYATETFAVGINMPAKTVCFGSLEKYDGVSFRVLNSKEYFQLAGRAGRRGIDTEGLAVSIIDRNHPELYKKIKEITTDDTLPITSRYTLSYNTILNLIKNHPEEQIKKLLISNFGYYIKRKEREGQVRIIQSYYNYSRILERLGFIENHALTWKGEFASRIYTKELEIAEIVYSKMLHELPLEHMAVLLASIIYEPRRADTFEIKGANIGPILKVIEKNTFVARKIKPLFIRRMSHIVTSWVEGESFEHITTLTNLAEGDIVRLFRQLIDVLRQIKAAIKYVDPQNELVDKCAMLLSKIDRDLVAIEL